MCIISGPVKGVAETQIFVGCDKHRSRQITIYGNKVENISQGNAMVLPVPYPDTVELIDLSKYKDIFKDCARDFYNDNLAFGQYSNSDGFRSNSTLAVFNVGSYAMSIAHGLSDLDRVDRSVFTLYPECRRVLSSHYSAPYWGFIICQLRSGNHKYHPVAYSHATLKGQYFIPTLHHHAHGASSWANANDGDWDHTIYVQNGVNVKQVVAAGKELKPWQNWGYDVNNNDEYKWKGTCSVDKTRLPFPLSNTRCFDRIDISGVYKNIDLYVPIRPRGAAI